MIDGGGFIEPEATPQAPATGGALDPEIRALLERAALVPGGLALLELAALECAAVLLGVTPRLLERARAILADPATRGEALGVVARATGGRPPAPARRDAPARPTPRGPQDLIVAARARPGGPELLLSAAPESAAIAFGVHPEMVLAARELARRGAAPDHPTQP